MGRSMARPLAVLVATVSVLSAAAAPGFKPNSTLSVNTWTNGNDKWFLYPEQSPSSDYYLPAIMKRPNFGIAVSGGGYRAVTLALGYVRALYMMNLPQQARYLTSNSGGSWFNSAFSYQRTMPVTEFLGPYVPPENLTMDALKATAKGEQGAFAATISNAVIKSNAAAGAVKDVVTQDDKGPGAWSDSIGNAFLAPYELNNDKSTFTAEGTQGPIHTNLDQIGDNLKVYRYQGAQDSQTEGNVSRPFPVVLGSLFNRVDNMSLYYPTEFTPEYIGIPPVIPNEYANKTIGGGFVDPVGFNSFPPEPVPKVPAALAATLGKVEGAMVKPLPKSARGLLQASTAAAAAPTPVAKAPPGTAANGAAAAAAPKGAAAGGNGSAAAAAGLNQLLPLPTEVNSSFVVPLKVAAGISSSFLAQGLAPADSEALKELTGTEELQYWNQVNFQGMKQSFADGGGVDNLAITPLLRRKVKFIVSCIAGSAPIASNTKIDDWAMEQWDIASLFGAVPLKHPKLGKKNQVNNMPPGVFNKVSQVFPKSGWAPMFKAFQSSTLSGGPVYHLAEYTLMDNAYQAVHGGWKVSVLWVINSQMSKWEDKLPEEVRGMLAKSRNKKGGLNKKKGANETGDADVDTSKGKAGRAELKDYPYVSTFNADYSPELTGLLNQQASWQMLALRPQLQKMLAGSQVVVGTPANVGTKTQDKNTGVPSKALKSAAGGLPASTWLPRAVAVVAAAAAPLLLVVA